MKIRCLIVDDERLARALLDNFVKKFPQLELVRQCESPVEAMECLKTEQIDLMFLDIQMPDLTGIEMLQTMSERPLVIFTTAYSEYALEGFKLDVIDYLLKPFSFDRFAKATNKAIQQIELQRKANSSAAKPSVESNESPAKDYMMVKADHKLYKVMFSDLLYIEGLKAYVSYYTTEKRIVALESLKNLEDLLPSDQFMRIHKSYIVPIKKVKSVEGNQLEIAGKMLPIGKNYKEEVVKRVFGN
jgi:DNA-binding LytR/AlgR family response regulator